MANSKESFDESDAERGHLERRDDFFGEFSFLAASIERGSKSGEKNDFWANECNRIASIGFDVNGDHRDEQILKWAIKLQSIAEKMRRGLVWSEAFKGLAHNIQEAANARTNPRLDVKWNTRFELQGVGEKLADVKKAIDDQHFLIGKTQEQLEIQRKELKELEEKQKVFGEKREEIEKRQAYNVRCHEASKREQQRQQPKEAEKQPMEQVRDCEIPSNLAAKREVMREDIGYQLKGIDKGIDKEIQVLKEKKGKIDEEIQMLEEKKDPIKQKRIMELVAKLEASRDARYSLQDKYEAMRASEAQMQAEMEALQPGLKFV